jgi:hypothetical protein
METVLKIIIGFWIGMMTTALVIYIFPEGTSAYQKGQIDALNGIVKYELKTNPDKTVVWVRKEN